MAVVPYASGSESKITADFVFRTVKAIVASGKEKDFLKQCAERDLRVTVDADAANFVRSFLDQEPRASLDQTLSRAIEGDTCRC